MNGTETELTVSLWAIVGLPLLEAVLVGLLAGLVGCLAVLNQRIFFTESVTHATFPGAVLGVVAVAGFGGGHAAMSMGLFVGAALACLPMALLMHLLSRVPGQSSQAAAGIVLTLGFALGYFMAKWFQPLPLKIEGFLTGSILNVGDADVLAVVAVLAVAAIVAVVAGRSLMFHAFDEQGYRAAGLSAATASAVTLLLIVATVVVLIPAVGTILPIALLAAPAAGLAPMLRSWRTLLIAAPVVGALIGATGLFLAVALKLSAGGMIALIAGVFYVAARVVQRALIRRGA